VLLPHYDRSRAVRAMQGSRTAAGSGLVVDFVARRPLLPWLGPGLPVAWRAQAWNEPASRQLRFRHLAGATRGMDVTWRIEPEGPGCRVSIDHLFAPRLPGWAGFVDRAFTRPIAGRTLATFKALAESLAESLGESLAEPAVESDPGAPPKKML